MSDELPIRIVLALLDERDSASLGEIRRELLPFAGSAELARAFASVFARGFVAAESSGAPPGARRYRLTPSGSALLKVSRDDADAVSLRAVLEGWPTSTASAAARSAWSHGN